jgi:hypothetical protein
MKKYSKLCISRIQADLSNLRDNPTCARINPGPIQFRQGVAVRKFAYIMSENLQSLRGDPPPQFSYCQKICTTSEDGHHPKILTVRKCAPGHQDETTPEFSYIGRKQIANNSGFTEGIRAPNIMQSKHVITKYKRTRQKLVITRVR